MERWSLCLWPALIWDIQHQTSATAHFDTSNTHSTIWLWLPWHKQGPWEVTSLINNPTHSSWLLVESWSACDSFCKLHKWKCHLQCSSGLPACKIFITFSPHTVCPRLWNGFRVLQRHRAWLPGCRQRLWASASKDRDVFESIVLCLLKAGLIHPLSGLWKNDSQCCILMWLTDFVPVD